MGLSLGLWGLTFFMAAVAPQNYCSGLSDCLLLDATRPLTSFSFPVLQSSLLEPILSLCMQDHLQVAPEEVTVHSRHYKRLLWRLRTLGSLEYQSMGRKYLALLALHKPRPGCPPFGRARVHWPLRGSRLPFHSHRRDLLHSGLPCLHMT